MAKHKRVAAMNSRAGVKTHTVDGVGGSYSRVLKPKDPNMGIQAAIIGLKLCKSGLLSYVYGGKTLHTKLKKYNFDVDAYIASGETAICDCSHFVGCCYAPLVKEFHGWVAATGGMESTYLATGKFTAASTHPYNDSGERAGDILLQPNHHTEMSYDGVDETNYASVSIAGGNISFGPDDGSGIVLEQNISKLMSSDNFEFISASTKTDNTSITGTAGSSAAKDFKNVLDKIAESSTEFEKHSAVTIADSSIKQIINTTKVIVPRKNISKGDLLVNTNIVEAPTILVELDGKLIGGYGNTGDKYPNYISSLTVERFNGKINKYSITLTYQVRFAEDPNFIDKLLSMTGYHKKIKIIYGDSNITSGLFREEEAIITDVSMTENVSGKSISYTITALSSIILTASTLGNFSSKIDRPSNIIRELLYTDSITSKKLLDIFPGMKNRTLVESSGLIPNNDIVIKTQSLKDMSLLEVLVYLVSGMYDNYDNTYSIVFYDDILNEYGGAYFNISPICKQSTDTLSGNYFDLTIGYPDDKMITNFNMSTDVYYPLVYDYNEKFQSYNYEIDTQGNLMRIASNSLISNNNLNRKNVIQSNWWKRVTEYPITAEVTMKCLTKPIMLMSHVIVDTLFYGNADIASGIYVVTGQKDSISGSGCRTTLQLLRVGNL